MGFFDKLKNGLTKTKKSFDEKINNVFSSFRKVDEDFLDELEEALIMSDIGMDTSVKIISNLRDRIKKEKIQEPEDVKQALRDEMKKIWDLESKFQYYLNVEIAVCEAYAENGDFPKKDIEELKKKASFSVQRIDEIEAEVKHDVIAFLTCVNESLGDLAKYMHVGMTSSDVIDTAFALQIQDSGKIILKDLGTNSSLISKKNSVLNLGHDSSLIP